MPICPFCEKLTVDTFQCKKCGTYFCKKCIEEHEFCPKCFGREFKKAVNVVEAFSPAARKWMYSEQNKDFGNAIGRGIVNITGRVLRKAGWKEAETPEEKKKKGCRIWLILLIGFILWLIVGIIMPYLYK